jgi:hypothetical protein
MLAAARGRPRNRAHCAPLARPAQPSPRRAVGSWATLVQESHCHRLSGNSGPIDAREPTQLASIPPHLRHGVVAPASNVGTPVGAGAGWAISLQSDREHVIGQVALRTLYLKEGLAECSYWVGPDYRGGGVAPQGTRALCTWAFNELHLHRLELVHSVRNRRSCRVALKAGFEPEGIERSLHPYWDGRHDMHLHARVKPAEARATLWAERCSTSPATPLCGRVRR